MGATSWKKMTARGRFCKETEMCPLEDKAKDESCCKMGGAPTLPLPRHLPAIAKPFPTSLSSRFIKIPGRIKYALARSIGILFTPLIFAYRTGHFYSALRGKAFDRQGVPQPWYTFAIIDFLKGKDLSAARSSGDRQRTFHVVVGRPGSRSQLVRVQHEMACLSGRDLHRLRCD